MENQLIKLTEQAPEHHQTGLPAIAAPPRPVSDTGWEVVVGRLVGLVGAAVALVELPRSNPGAPMTARTIVAISETEVGQQAVLAFEEGDLTKPIVLGLIKTAGIAPRKATLSADDDKFVVVAEREIELRCGEASITLTRAGKVLIKGEYVLTRSKGINRIKGAAVSIN